MARRTKRRRLGNPPDPKLVADRFLRAASRSLNDFSVDCGAARKGIMQAYHALNRATGDTTVLDAKYERVKTKYEGRC